MFSLTRLAQASYLLAFCSVVFLLLPAKSSQAQSHVTTGFRGTPALPPIIIPVFSGSGRGFGGGFGGGIAGFGGGFAGSSFNFSMTTINLANFFPNGGRLIGMPPPTLMPPLNNFLFGFVGFPPFLGFPSLSDSTGAPWSMLTGLGLFNIGGGFGGLMLGGFGAGGFGGGGFAGGGVSGFGAGGVSGFGVAGFGAAGFGMGGFAGKGFGGFNGRKPL